MDLSLSSDDRALLDELRSFVAEHKPEAIGRWDRWNPPGDHSLVRPEAMAFVKQLGQAGLLGVDLPREWGGRGATSVQAHLLFRELAGHNLPSGGQGVWSIAPALLRHGTDEQRRTYLPGLLSGEIHFALGLTEPGGGTDLANLKTRAVRSGDTYLVNGQKAFTTQQHWASHIWLAVRTSETAPRHRGISVLIVDADAPGITALPMYTQAGERTNMVYFDDVRVPVANLVGEENHGFRILMEAVDYERLAVSGPELEPLLDIVIGEWRAQRAQASEVAAGQLDALATELGQLTADIRSVRVMGFHAAWQHDRGRPINSETAMLKLWTARLREQLASFAIALLTRREPTTPEAATAIGYFENLYLAAALFKFGAGGLEVLQDIIAEVTLRMPRSR
jgi:alkylation response protein AidB-like acyl-CoA dehydrogenase